MCGNMCISTPICVACDFFPLVPFLVCFVPFWFVCLFWVYLILLLLLNVHLFSTEKGKGAVDLDWKVSRKRWRRENHNQNIL